MADERLIAGGIKDPASTLFNQLLDRMAGLPIERVLVYFVDFVQSDVLPHLADQFHVLGDEGWTLCENDTQRRALVKNALALHRHKGTPWAIRRAIQAVGYRDATIEEGRIAALMDGVYNMDGSITMASGGEWARFNVAVDLGEEKGLNQAQKDLVRALVLSWKNERSHLDVLSFTASLLDLVAAQEQGETVVVPHPYDLVPRAPIMDGTYQMNQAAFRLIDGSVLMDGSVVMDGLAWVGLLMDSQREQLGFDFHLKSCDQQQARANRTARMDGALKMDAGLPLMDGDSFMTGQELMGGQGLILMDGQYIETGVAVEELSVAYGLDLTDSQMVGESTETEIHPSPVDLIGRGPLMDGSLLMNQSSLRLMDGSDLMDGSGQMDGVVPGGICMDNETNPLASNVVFHLVDRNEAEATRPARMDGTLQMNGGFRLMDGTVLMNGQTLAGQGSETYMDGFYKERDTVLDGQLKLTVRRVQFMNGSLVMGGDQLLDGSSLMDGEFQMDAGLRLMNGGVILEEVAA